MKKVTVLLLALMFALLLINQSFGEVIYAYDYEGINNFAGQERFGKLEVEEVDGDNALIFKSENQDLYVQYKLNINAGYDFYSLGFDMKAVDFIDNGINTFNVIFDTPVVSVSEFSTHGNLTKKTYPSPGNFEIIGQIEDDQWLHFDFYLNFPGNEIQIFKNSQMLHEGFFGASSDDLVSIRFSLGNYGSFYNGTYSLDNKIIIDDLQIIGSDTSTSPVPIPATVWLLGSGIGLMVMHRKKKNR